MGLLPSLSGRSTTVADCEAEPCKRTRMSASFVDRNPLLIPSLPDEIPLMILARLLRICYMSVKMVSAKWRVAVISAELCKMRKELGTAEEWLYVLTKTEEDRLFWYAFKPVGGRWLKLHTVLMDFLMMHWQVEKLQLPHSLLSPLTL